MSDPQDLELLSNHAAFVRSIARGLLSDDQAEDVVQESLLVSLQRPPRGNPRAWLGAVARKLALMRRRSEGRRLRRERRAARDEALPSTAEAVARIEMQQCVVERVLALPEPYRTTIIQRYLYETSLSELAERLGVPQETVRTRVKRGLAKLRAQMDKKTGGRSAWATLLLPSLGGTDATTAKGALFMSIKTKSAIAVSLALLVTALLGGHFFIGKSEVAARAPSNTTTAMHEETPEDAAVEPLPPPVDLDRVDRELDLHGVVVTTEGAPVEGADLAVVFYPWRRVNVLAVSSDESRDGPRTRSAKDGTFKLRLQRGDGVALRVHADGFAPIEVTLLQAGEKVRVVLTSGVSARFRVHDTGQQPIAGAEVLLITRDTEQQFRALTDDTGVAVLEGLRPKAPVYLAATHPLYGAPRGTKTMLPAEGTLEHAIELGDGKIFAGRVTDARTGLAIQNARVGTNLWLLPHVRTDDSGQYRLNGWIGPRWGHAIYVLAPGFAPGYKVTGGETTIDFALNAGASVTGRILGADGRPVGKALVSALGEQNGTLLDHAQATSDRHGRFGLDDLNKDIAHVLIASAPGHGRVLLDFTPTSPELGDIELPRALAIAGEVTDHDNNPLPRCSITLHGANADRRTRSLTDRSGPSHYGQQENRNTDDLGRFRFPDLASGRYTLYCGDGESGTTSRVVELGEEDVRDVRIVLKRGRPFRIHVVDDHGAPLDASVQVKHAGGTSHGRTDENGELELRVVGKVTVVHAPYVFAREAAYGAVEALENPRDDKAHFTVPRWESITGKVVDADGKALGSIQVKALAGDKELRSATSTASGTFLVAVPPGSSVDLVIAGQFVKSGHGTSLSPTHTGRLDRVAAGSKDVTLVAAPIASDRALRVRVLTPDGKPVESARVYFTPAPPNRTFRAYETNAEGWVDLDELPATTISVGAFLHRGTEFVSPQPAALVPNGQVVTLRCRRGVLIDGKVTLPDGTGAEGARVTVQCEKQFYTAVCDADGKFQMTVPDAECKIAAHLMVEGTVRFHAIPRDLRPGAKHVELKLEAFK